MNNRQHLETGIRERVTFVAKTLQGAVGVSYPTRSFLKAIRCEDLTDSLELFCLHLLLSQFVFNSTSQDSSPVDRNTLLVDAFRYVDMLFQATFMRGCSSAQFVGLKTNYCLDFLKNVEKWLPTSFFAFSSRPTLYSVFREKRSTVSLGWSSYCCVAFFLKPCKSCLLDVITSTVLFPLEFGLNSPVVTFLFLEVGGCVYCSTFYTHWYNLVNLSFMLNIMESFNCKNSTV